MSSKGPQKKKKTKGGRYSHEITKEEIEMYYHMPCEEASKQLGIGLTILKRICRRLGIDKWPYRQLKRQGKLNDPMGALGGGGGNGGGGNGANMLSPFQPRGAANGHVQVEQQQQQQQQQQVTWGRLQAELGLSRSDSGDSGGSWQAQHRSPGFAVLPIVGQSQPAPLMPPPAAAAGGSPPFGSALSGPATLKRIREDDIDALQAFFQPEHPANPFAAAAVVPDVSAGDSGAAMPAAGADQLAASLNRLAMRTLSLKRQCSRDDAGGLDALDQALLQERMDAQQAQAHQQQRMAMGLSRACSMPSAGSSGQRGGLPLPRHQQQRAAMVRGAGGQLDGWMALEQVRLPPLPPGQHRAAAVGGGATAASPFGDPQAQVVPVGGPTGMGAMESIEEPPDADLGLGSDPSLSALLFGMGAMRRATSNSDGTSDGGLLQETGSGILSLAHASSSGSAQRGGGEAALKRDTSAVFLRQQAQEAAATVVGVTSVGAAADEDADNDAKKLYTDSLSARLKPLWDVTASGDLADHEVADLLADFLGPDPGSMTEGKMAELLTAFSPLVSPHTADPVDPLAALESPQPPAVDSSGQADNMAPAVKVEEPANDGGHASAFAQVAQQPAASGSMLSRDTPASSAAANADASPVVASAFELAGGDQAADVMQLASRLVSDPDPVKQLLANRILLMQQQQAQQQAQQAQQQQQLLAHHAAQQQMLMQAQAGGAQGWQSVAPGADSPALMQLTERSVARLQQSVARLVQLEEAYQRQRHAVRVMLAQRGSAPAGMEGDTERLEQLAQLKKLKQQLASARSRHDEFVQQHESLLGQVKQARMQQQQHQQQQQRGMFLPPLQPGLQPMGQAAAGGSAMGDMGSAFGAVPPLGPPPPLPSQRSQYGGQQEPNVASLFSQWVGDGDSLDLNQLQQVQGGQGGWQALAPTQYVQQMQHGVPQQQWLQLGLQQQQQTGVQHLMAQRAASAPLPYDLDWAALM